MSTNRDRVDTIRNLALWHKQRPRMLYQVFFLDPENQPGFGKIRNGSGALGLTGDVWHQKYKNKKEGVKNYLTYSFNRLLKISLSLRYRAPDPVFGQNRILIPDQHQGRWGDAAPRRAEGGEQLVARRFRVRHGHCQGLLGRCLLCQAEEIGGMCTCVQCARQGTTCMTMTQIRLTLRQ